MTENIILSPFGTARALYLGSASLDEGRMPRLLAHLAIAIQDFNLKKEMVQLAYEAAKWQGSLTADEQQAFLLMVLCSLIMQQQGSTRMPLQDGQGVSKLAGILNDLLKPRGASENNLPKTDETIALMKKVVNDGLANSILGRDGEYKPFIFDGSNFYHYKMLQLEKRIVDRLKSLLAEEPMPLDEEQAKILLESGLVTLEDEQAAAVQKAMQFSFSIITGGPGTGKTHVIVSIVKLLLHQGIAPEAIALAAPTGKAANRMGASIQDGLQHSDSLAEKMAAIPEPRTLHRLLGYSPEQDLFKHHRNNPLQEEVVIIDEASMIDLYLIERLLGAMRKKSRLILIGDAEQLPSVDAGAVLKDLVLAGGGYVSRLEKSHRMNVEGPGKSIYAMAQAVRTGAGDDLVHDSRLNDVIRECGEVGDLLFTGVELYDPQASKRRFLVFLNAWAERFWPRGSAGEERMQAIYHYTREGFAPGILPQLDLVFSDSNRSKILGLTRAFQSGIDAINGYFHERAVKTLLPGGAKGTEYLPGEPVMMQRNDYDKKIFNGDQGVILNIATENCVQPMAVFKQSGGYGAFSLDSLRASLTHAYAITVHKSQGSEYDHVALILPDQEIPILTRELIYTGVTRSRLSVAIIGSRKILKAGVCRQVVRFSGIAERMAAG